MLRLPTLLLLLVGILAAACSSAPKGPKTLGRRPLGPTYLPFASTFECDDVSDNYGAIAFQRIRAIDGRCEIAIKPKKIEKDRFRTYLLSSTGSIIIYNSYGGGFKSDNNAMRSFFIFPRLKPPTFNVEGDEDVEVRLPSEETVRFSAANGRIAAMSGGLQYKEDPTLSRDNAGGVEILSYERGLVLDTGWQHGGVAHAHLDRESTFIDPVGNRCVVKNREIFVLKNREPYLKHEVDADLIPFLETRCPQLNLQPLIERVFGDV